MVSESSASSSDGGGGGGRAGAAAPTTAAAADPPPPSRRADARDAYTVGKRRSWHSASPHRRHRNGHAERRRSRSPLPRTCVDQCMGCADVCCTVVTATLGFALVALLLMGLTAPATRLVTRSRATAILVFYITLPIALTLLVSRWTLRRCIRWRRARAESTRTSALTVSGKHT